MGKRRGNRQNHRKGGDNNALHEAEIPMTSAQQTPESESSQAEAQQ